MAAEIKSLTGLSTLLEPGNRGEFTVWVDDVVVARKSFEGFPEPEAAAAAVKAAL